METKAEDSAEAKARDAAVGKAGCMVNTVIAADPEAVDGGGLVSDLETVAAMADQNKREGKEVGPTLADAEEQLRALRVSIGSCGAQADSLGKIFNVLKAKD